MDLVRGLYNYEAPYLEPINHTSSPNKDNPSETIFPPDLPTELYDLIFSELSPTELQSTALVSKAWHAEFSSHIKNNFSREVANFKENPNSLSRIVKPIPATRTNVIFLRNFFSTPEHFLVTTQQTQESIKILDLCLKNYLELSDARQRVSFGKMYEKLHILNKDPVWKKAKFISFIQSNHLLKLTDLGVRLRNNQSLQVYEVQLQLWISSSLPKEFHELICTAFFTDLHKQCQNFLKNGGKEISLNIRYVENSPGNLFKNGVEFFLNNFSLPTNVTSLRLFGGPQQFRALLGYLFKLEDVHVPALSTIIAENPSLKELYLEGSDISQEGFSVLNEMMESRGGSVIQQ